MEISGKIIVATEPRTGTSARTGSKWVAQDFVIETHEQYPKRCVFGVFGEDRLREFNINVGDELTVSFDIDAHEYNGRWCNSLRAWRVQRASDAVAVDKTTVFIPFAFSDKLNLFDDVVLPDEDGPDINITFIFLLLAI